ncbi:hypothetical protein ABIA39_003726 [Nocardia sp. GAS34]|uniref:RDD family protein n=1 Tax=unclassified Nocardia TaxID=2637762 RepID=UPI003D1C2A05
MSYGSRSKGRGDDANHPPRQEIRGIETFARLDEQVETPRPYGEGVDPRYPSPRLLRWVSAFVVDWLLHAGPMIAVFAILARDGELADRFPQARLWAIISWPILSFVNRTIVQRIFHATVGKALFGLVAIRPEDGGCPTYGRLVKVWLFGLLSWLIVAISAIGNYIGGSGGYRDGIDFVLPAVRRMDVTSGK